MMVLVAGAQELEEVLPKKVEVSEIDYSEDIEPTLIPTSTDSSIVSAIRSLDAVEVSKQNIEKEQVAAKEAQLGMILRNAYYQKITTPRWAKILSTKSWKKSFLKWRYYAQIEDYVRSSSVVIATMNRTPSLEIRGGAPEQTETMTIISSDTMATDQTDGGDNEEIPRVDNEEIPQVDNEEIPQEATALLDNPKETTEEEVFDKGANIDLGDTIVVGEKVERFLFTKSDLSLPDSLIAERVLYPTKSELPVESAITATEIAQEDTNPKQELEPKELEEETPNSELIKPRTETGENSESTVAARPKEVKKETPIATIEVKEPNNKEPKQSTAVPITQDRRNVTEQFASRYGKLPWPVKGGKITDRYGSRSNAEVRGLKRENYGIDITAPSASRVRAVFSGTVLMAINQAPYDYIVTLKHGDFTTAYYFLERINVKVGDWIKVGQDLGRLRQQQDMAPFHFEIWQDQERMNPESWLKR